MSKPKLIIVEGADCNGKSTLSRALARTLDAVYWHFTSSKTLAPANRDYMVNGLENARENLDNGSFVVFDRFWPSERCYGPVLRGPLYDVAAVLEIEKLTAEFDPIYILCKDIDGLESAVKRHNENQDADHPYREHVYGQIYGNYLAWQVEADAKGDQIIAYYFDDKVFRRGVLGVDQAQLNAILEQLHLA